MRIHGGLREAASRLQGGAVAIGNFDGAHKGHRALFDAARRRAFEGGGPSAALTFEPHPAHLLAPDYAPPLICTPLRKRELIAACGIDALVVQPFDRTFSATGPDEFVAQLAGLGVKWVVVGHDFTYGRGRAGNVQTLRAALEARGVSLHVVEPVTVDGLVVSSTKVREFVLAGRMDAAAALLGRSFDVDGEVVRGAARGRTLGWPTANVNTTSQLLPAIGVYAVRVRVLEEAPPGVSPATGVAPSQGNLEPLRWSPAIPGAANLGLNPTFRSSSPPSATAPLALEVHLIDFSADLYGRTLRVEFEHRLREERRFSGIDALKAQIAADVEQARRLLAGA